MQRLKFSFPNVPYVLEDVKQLTVTPIWSMQPEGLIGVYHIAASLQFGEVNEDVSFNEVGNRLELDGEAIEHVEFHYPNGYFEYAYPMEFDALEGHVEQLAVNHVQMTIEQGQLVVEWDVQVVYEDTTSAVVERIEQEDVFVKALDERSEEQEELVLNNETDILHELPVVTQTTEEQAEAVHSQQEIVQVEHQPVVEQSRLFAQEEQPFLEELKEQYTIFHLNKIGQQ